MQNKKKKVSILGSTGSIGCNSLEVIDSLNNNGYEIKVAYLTTNTKIDELASQIRKYSPSGVVIQDKESFSKFKSEYNFKGLEILSGREGLIEISSRDDYNFLINALVGFSGLEPTIAAIKSGKDIALANKETLVVAGKLITDLIKENGNLLLPIDSEHSAIFQCLTGESKDTIAKIILTASGGPFINKSFKEMGNITVEEALNHPNWKMGNKITIDSATMMNKGLEVIEAKWLFDVGIEKIKVVIHPQSVIHSMVEFNDGSVKAQLGVTDMKLPIQYSLTYPYRVYSDFPKLDFQNMRSLTFEEPDLEKFSCLKIAYEVLEEEGTYPTVMNAANEIAVDLFLKNKINFLKIPGIIQDQLNKHDSKKDFSLENILETDTLTRNNILNKYKV